VLSQRALRLALGESESIIFRCADNINSRARERARWRAPSRLPPPQKFTKLLKLTTVRSINTILASSNAKEALFHSVSTNGHLNWKLKPVHEPGCLSVGLSTGREG
jgi:hypothetical protein